MESSYKTLEALFNDESLSSYSMRYFAVFLVLLGIVGSFSTMDDAYGLWVPLSPEELMQQSKTIFVGTIADIGSVDVEYQSKIAQDGTIKENVGPEILPLEEYTVTVEEFLKNPHDTDTMKVLRATVSGVPGGPSRISGFEIGDRVLFYLPKDEKQTHFAGQYLPESFKIPTECAVRDVLNAERIDGQNRFTKIQNGVEIKDDTFTAGIPIQFHYDRDVGTLFGQSFDVSVGINNITDNTIRNVFQKTIQVNIDPCKWIGSAQWDFVPYVGEYRLNMHVSTEGGGSGSSTRFFAVASDEIIPPLKQFNTGIFFDQIQCKENLILLQKYDGSPSCVTEQTKQKLIDRGWAETPHVDIIQKVPPVSVDPADISSASNQFALDYYSNLTQNDSTSNVFFSPTSISTAFSILYEGARQDTSTEIQNVFGFPEDEQTRKHGYMSLHQSINKQSNTDTALSIANALWLAENFEPLAEYVDTATTYYDSTVSTVDFVSDEGVDKINEWVDEKTQGKIPDILKLGSTGSSTKMAITNAIYFKGMWEHQFDPEDTYESEFMVDKDNSVKVQMMAFPHKMQVNYAVTEKMEMIELPYRNSTVSMLIILPNKIDDLRAVEESITIDNLKRWKEFPTMNRGININIPKFTLETEYDLTKQLPDMGMPTVFNPVHADLSGITGYKSLYVSQAIHKAFVEVNEEGTEAAGATVITLDESGGPTFMADHPFIFIIWDNETDSILFMGRVANPTE